MYDRQMISESLRRLQKLEQGEDPKAERNLVAAIKKAAPTLVLDFAHGFGLPL